MKQRNSLKAKCSGRGEKQTQQNKKQANRKWNNREGPNGSDHWREILKHEREERKRITFRGKVRQRQNTGFPGVD